MNDGVGVVGGAEKVDEKVTADASDRTRAGCGSGGAAVRSLGAADDSGGLQEGGRGSGGLHDEGGGAGGLHEEGSAGLHDEGGSLGPQGGDWGLEGGGNSDSGGPDDELAGGKSSAGGGTGWRDGDCGPAKPDEDGSAGRTRGANGLRRLRPKPHTWQNGPDTGAPQAGQGSPPLAPRGPGPWCFPVLRSGPAGLPSMSVPQTSQKSSLAESWPSGHTAIADPPL